MKKKQKRVSCYTRSSATAEKQRVSYPHGGGLGPPAHSPSAPSGYTYALWSNPKPAINLRQACHPLSTL